MRKEMRGKKQVLSASREAVAKQVRFTTPTICATSTFAVRAAESSSEARSRVRRRRREENKKGVPLTWTAKAVKTVKPFEPLGLTSWGCLCFRNSALCQNQGKGERVKRVQNEARLKVKNKTVFPGARSLDVHVWGGNGTCWGTMLAHAGFFNVCLVADIVSFVQTLHF